MFSNFYTRIPLSDKCQFKKGRSYDGFFCFRMCIAHRIACYQPQVLSIGRLTQSAEWIVMHASPEAQRSHSCTYRNDWFKRFANRAQTLQTNSSAHKRSTPITQEPIDHICKLLCRSTNSRQVGG